MTYLSRRTMVKTLACTWATATVTAASAIRVALAGEPEKLSPTDPAAVALGYTPDAAQVDARKYPAYVKGSTCENCLQLQGKAGEAFRPCSLFKGKVVSAKGWCTSWTAEM